MQITHDNWNGAPSPLEEHGDPKSKPYTTCQDKQNLTMNSSFATHAHALPACRIIALCREWAQQAFKQNLGSEDPLSIWTPSFSLRKKYKFSFRARTFETLQKNALQRSANSRPVSSVAVSSSEGLLLGVSKWGTSKMQAKALDTPRALLQNLPSGPSGESMTLSAVKPDSHQWTKSCFPRFAAFRSPSIELLWRMHPILHPRFAPTLSLTRILRKRCEVTGCSYTLLSRSWPCYTCLCEVTCAAVA